MLLTYFYDIALTFYITFSVVSYKSKNVFTYDHIEIERTLEFGFIISQNKSGMFSNKQYKFNTSPY